MWPSGALLYVDAWLGCVIGCVAEAGHVRPRASHATVALRAALGVVLCSQVVSFDVPADGHLAPCALKIRRVGGLPRSRGRTVNPWGYDSPPSAESPVKKFLSEASF